MLRALVGGKLCRIAHVVLIAYDGRLHGFSCPCLLQIVAITAAPLPRIVEIEHGQHAPTLHFLQQIVQPVEHTVIINAGRTLQSGRHFGLNALLTIAPHEHAEVVNAHAFEPI